MFSGDYVRLNYKISSIPLPQEQLNSLKRNQTIYVVLSPGDPYWTADGAYITEPKVSPPKIVIKGRVAGISKDQVYIEYGIESYFVPEGEGKTLQQPLPQDTISIRVSVDQYGNAAIAALLLNQKEIYKETLY